MQKTIKLCIQFLGLLFGILGLYLLYFSVQCIGSWLTAQESNDFLYSALLVSIPGVLLVGIAYNSLRNFGMRTIRRITMLIMYLVLAWSIYFIEQVSPIQDFLFLRLFAAIALMLMCYCLYRIVSKTLIHIMMRDGYILQS